MRFFFHVIGNGQAFRDQDGEIFGSFDAAQSNAARIAHELRHDAYEGCTVSVTDEAGTELVRVTIGNGKDVD
jgi:hypothetical protein